MVRALRSWKHLETDEQRLSLCLAIVPFGANGDIPVAADYDGDAKGDLVVFRPSTGVWYGIPSITNSPYQLQWGISGDTPVPGDYDRDGKMDVAVWRGSTGVWYRLNSSNGSVGIDQWGTNGDIPAQGDFDFDGKTDLLSVNIGTRL